jgi:aryl-alcohol dehydrogenase-like predicted oxidoreductase
MFNETVERFVKGGTMNYRKLGRTGLKVSPLCLGTMQFGWTADEETSIDILTAAFEAGINFIDTADIYSSWVDGNPGGVSETIIGNWIRERKIPRDQLVLATKVRVQMGEGPNDEGLSRIHIMQSVENSLLRMGIETIDLYQAHWYDDDTPIDETLKAFDDLIRQGKVRYIGCSNYPAWKLMEALWVSDKLGLSRYDCLQPHYNLVHRAEFERELAPVCRTYRIGVVPYSPLAGGFLTGKYRQDDPLPDSARATGVQAQYFNEKNWELLARMKKFAEKREGGTISQVALAWQLADPLITSPIIGPRTLAQLVDNLGALQIELTATEKEELDQVSAWNS